jgi:hypothetical protein
MKIEVGNEVSSELGKNTIKVKDQIYDKRNELALVLADARYFNSISGPSSETWQTSFIFIYKLNVR